MSRTMRGVFTHAQATQDAEDRNEEPIGYRVQDEKEEELELARGRRRRERPRKLLMTEQSARAGHALLRRLEAEAQESEVRR